ncbi:MAG: Uma2 family endonuclease [Cyanobacteria bacterium P01_D01_bin.115]
MVALSQSPLTPDEYLQLETESVTKHEYLNGDVYAMAGASDVHVTIAGNIFALLRNHVRGSGCRVYIADMKARIEARNCFYYPDVMVTGDERDRENSTFKRFPKLIVEVFSDSTESFDRGDKFTDYQTLDTLDEYVIINTRHQRVECFRRTPDNLWLLQTYTAESDQLELQSLGFTDAIGALYEDAELEPTPTPPA